MLHIALWRYEEKIGDEVSSLKTNSNLFLWRFFPYERLWFDNSQEYLPGNSDIMLKGKKWFPHVSLQRQTQCWFHKAFYSILFFLCCIRKYPEYTRNKKHFFCLLLQQSALCFWSFLSLKDIILFWSCHKTFQVEFSSWSDKCLLLLSFTSTLLFVAWWIFVSHLFVLLPLIVVSFLWE